MNNTKWQQAENDYFKHHDPYNDDELEIEPELYFYFECSPCRTHWKSADKNEGVCPLCGNTYEWHDVEGF